MPIRDKFCATYTHYEDSSHGYLKVPLAELRKLGVKISGYSYKHGRFAYLEEDLDLLTFAKAAAAAAARAKATSAMQVSVMYGAMRAMRDEHAGVGHVSWVMRYRGFSAPCVQWTHTL